VIATAEKEISEQLRTANSEIPADEDATVGKSLFKGPKIIPLNRNGEVEDPRIKKTTVDDWKVCMKYVNNRKI